MGFAGYQSHDQGTEVSASMRRKHATKPRKTVFATDEVAHIWAQQNQPWARNGKASVYFDGPTIYSYGRHFPMARFTTDKRGNVVVLYNSASYSQQTSQHQHAAWSAVKNATPKFSVVDCLADDANAHGTNFEAMRKAFNEANADARNRRSRAWGRENAIKTMHQTLEAMASYRAAFLNGNKYRLPTLPQDLEFVQAQIAFDDHAKQLRVVQRMLERKTSKLRGYDNGRATRLRDLRHQYRDLVRHAGAMSRIARTFPLIGKAPTVDYKHALKMWRAIGPKIRFVGEPTYRGWARESTGFGGHMWRERDANDKRDAAVAHPTHVVESAREYLSEDRERFYAILAESTVRQLEELSDHCAEHRLPMPITPVEVSELIVALKAKIEEANIEAERATAKRESERQAAIVLAAEYGRMRKRALNGDADAIREIEQAWRDGAMLDYSMRDMFTHTLLRVTDDGKTVETSMGARVPADHAKLAWRKIKRCAMHAETFTTNGKRISVGHYHIDSIDAKGNVVAGCHRLDIDELLRCAVALGLEPRANNTTI